MTEGQSGPTVLVVDDSFTNRTLLKKILGNDFTVEQAEDGAAALEALRSCPGVAAVILDIEMPVLDGFGVLAAMQADPRLREIPVVVDTIVDDVDSQLRALDGGAADILIKPFNPRIALHRVKNLVMRREASREAARAESLEKLLRQSETDEKTGLFNKQGFCRKAGELMRQNPDTDYVILRWDVDHFKVFNDMYGVHAGDEFLASLGRTIQKYTDDTMVYGRWDADHFVMCLPRERFKEKDVAKRIADYRFDFRQEFQVFIRVGVYEVRDRSLDVELMCDRALLALHSIKGNFQTRLAYYDDSMRAAMLEEQEIVSEMEQALDEGQFVVYFQPQMNFESGRIIGAEALVRWLHPAKGLIPPDHFIPIFERNGFVTRLDQFVFESVLKRLRAWIDAGLLVVPISVNISRKDIYSPYLVERIIELVERYGIPTKLVRLEITESAYMENAAQLIKTVNALRSHGFAVEMDDFGSGYSSLNTLKTVPVDKLKLDIRFLEKGADGDTTRGGSILSAVMRMATWLRLPVIAEGVETRAQAEYLKSIGCLHMQGYLFAKPMPAEDFERRLQSGASELNAGAEALDGLEGAADFLSDGTQATLLFNSFVGGAGIVEFDGEHVEALRLNDRFFEELGISREDYGKYRIDLLTRYDGKGRAAYIAAVWEAIKTCRESCCELASLPFEPGQPEIWTKTRFRMLAKNGDRYVLYLSVENITERVRLSEQLNDILNSVPGGIGDFKLEDGVLRLIYHNGRMAEMFGFTPEEYDRSFQDDPFLAVLAEDRERVTGEMQAAYESGADTLETNYRHIRADGGFGWAQISAHILRRRGKAAYISAIVSDVTDRIDRENERQWQAEKFRILSESAGMITFDYAPLTEAMRLSIPEPGAGVKEERITGYLKNFDRYGRVPDGRKEAFTAALGRACERAKSGTYDFEGNYFGKTRWYRANYASLADLTGRVYRVVGRLDDITDIKAKD